MATRRIPDPKIGGSIPSGVIFLFLVGTLLSPSVRGLVVMIVACQVMDPGSIPGERIFCFFVMPSLSVSV
jgi:hypothetical protein